MLAQWIVDGIPPIDVGEVNIDRMLPYQNNPRYLQDRVVEILGLMYKETFPNTQLETARDVRKSILHERLGKGGRVLWRFRGLGIRRLVRARGQGSESRKI